MQTHSTIDEYIANFPEDVQHTLQTIRDLIHQTVPEATEKISYGIPTFAYHGNLVHFAAYDKHIGFYPGSGPLRDYAELLTEYETSKGTVRFPLDNVPLNIVKKLTLAAAQRNLEKKR